MRVSNLFNAWSTCRVRVRDHRVAKEGDIVTYSRPTPTVEPETGNEKLSIRNLSAITGLPLRTIRYYVGKGLCPPPYGQRRAAYYDQTHVLALMELRRRLSQGYRLSEVKASKDSGLPLPERPMRGSTGQLHELVANNSFSAHTEKKLRTNTFFPLSEAGIMLARTLTNRPEHPALHYRKTDLFEIIPGLELRYTQQVCPVPLDAATIESIAKDIFERLTETLRKKTQKA